MIKKEINLKEGEIFLIKKISILKLKKLKTPKFVILSYQIYDKKDYFK
jgi:hypothetical protein